MYRADAWDVSLTAELGPLGGGAGAAPGAGTGAVVGYLGGHQIQWLKQYIALVNHLPPQASDRPQGRPGPALPACARCAAAPPPRAELPPACCSPPAPPCPQLRQVSRRGSFFWRKPPAAAPKKGFGKMMRQASGGVAGSAPARGLRRWRGGCRAVPHLLPEPSNTCACPCFFPAAPRSSP